MAFDLASAKPIAPQKTGSFDLSSVKEPEAKEKKKKMSDYLLPAMFSGYEPERGDRTIWGDIGERPGAAIRSGIRSKAKGGSFKEGYAKGSDIPEDVPSFQESSLDKYWSSPERTHSWGDYAKGMGVSAAGLAADIATNPADMLLAALPKLPLKGGKTLGQAFAKTKPAQALKRFGTKERNLGFGTSDKWFTKQAKHGQKVVADSRKALGNAYDDIYKKVGDVPVDSRQVDEILLSSDIDDVVLKDIDRIVKRPIDSVIKVKQVNDILKKRTPQSYFLAGGTAGKGGLTNPKIRQKSSMRAMKDLIADSIGMVDKASGNKLKALNKYAYEKVYPHIEKLESVFGKRGMPKTEELAAMYQIMGKRSLGKASQREAAKGLPEVVKGLKPYIAGDFKKDLAKLARHSKELIKHMNQYRRKQLYKVGAVGASLYGASKLKKALSSKKGGRDGGDSSYNIPLN